MKAIWGFLKDSWEMGTVAVYAYPGLAFGLILVLIIPGGWQIGQWIKWLFF